jgi:cell division protein FtsB
MLNFYEKRKLQSILFSKPFLVFLCIPVGFLSFVAWNAYTTAEGARMRRLELTAELGGLKEHAELLERDLALLDDPRGIEAELRKRYEVGKEGEELIILVEEEKPPEQTIVPIHKPTVWERIKGWF